MNERRQLPLSEAVRRMRWLIVIGILVSVILHQVLEESVLEFGSSERITTGIVLYAGVGSLVTWIALSWVSNRIADGERAKQKFREEEAYISSVVSASADAILTLDNQHNIRSWNAGAKLIFGYDEQEIVGQHISKLVPAHIQQTGEIEKLDAACREKGYMRNLETGRLHKDGRKISVELTQTALTNSYGQVTGYSKVLRDITARKEAEEMQQESYERIVAVEHEIRIMNLELENRIAQRTESLEQAYAALEKTNEELRRANEQLQELDRMKSEFVSMVSHSLRAPVTNINGAIYLLIQSEEFTESDDRQELLEIIGAESDRLTRLVQGILSVSRLEGSRLDLKKEAVDMPLLSRKLLQSLQATTQNHSLSLLCSEDLPDVCADADCVEEVLVNLLANAIKYSPAGSHTTVELSIQEDFLITSVTDKGIGIEERELERIFERFHRVDGSDSGATGGYGLGLYIAKRLVEAMGGTIWARSTAGIGSTVSFSLPMQ